MVGLQASSDVPTHCSTVRWQSRHPRRRAVAMAVRVPRHNGACRTRQRAPSLPALVLAAHRTGHCMVKLGHALQQWRSCWVAAGSASTQLNTAHRLGIHSAQRRFASACTLPQLATDLLGGSRLPRSVLFSAWALHYGSHATTARAGTRTAARGRLGMYLARRRRHEGAAAARAGFTARSLRYSGQCAHYASVHTPSQHVLPARSSLGTYSSARARTPHSWLRSNTVLACIWLDAGAMRATSDRTHGPCCWRCVAVSDGSWFGAGHLMARPPMQYAPRPLVAHRNLGIRLARSRRRTIHRTHASKTTRAIFAGARCSLGVRVVRSWHYTRARRQQHACHVC